MLRRNVSYQWYTVAHPSGRIRLLPACLPASEETAVCVCASSSYGGIYKKELLCLPMTKSRVISKLSQLLAMLGATFNKLGTMPL